MNDLFRIQKLHVHAKFIVYRDSYITKRVEHYVPDTETVGVCALVTDNNNNGFLYFSSQALNVKETSSMLISTTHSC